jgi:hypothetical protein
MQVGVGEHVNFHSSSSRVDWSNCPGPKLRFSPGSSHVVAEVRGSFFRTRDHSTLWAPLSAVRACAQVEPRGDLSLLERHDPLTCLIFTAATFTGWSSDRLREADLDRLFVLIENSISHIRDSNDLGPDVTTFGFLIIDALLISPVPCKLDESKAEDVAQESKLEKELPVELPARLTLLLQRFGVLDTCNAFVRSKSKGREAQAVAIATRLLAQLPKTRQSALTAAAALLKSRLLSADYSASISADLAALLIKPAGVYQPYFFKMRFNNC